MQSILDYVTRSQQREQHKLDSRFMDWSRFFTDSLSSGEEVSCIPIHEQPSLKALPDANAYSQGPKFVPSSYPRNRRILQQTGEEKSTIDEADIRPAEQLFKSESGSCPVGTVPVLRNQLLANRTSNAYVRYRYHGNGFSTLSTDGSTLSSGIDLSHHQWSQAYNGGVTGEFGGAGFNLNVWHPSVELSSEFSLSQVWITAGSYEHNNLNTIEVGWQVFQDLYNDTLPHLFVYWTRDGYNTTGCYNLDPRCQPGFVQTSKTLLVGGALSPISETDGPQYELKTLVFLDEGQGVWWLQINNDTVGYWPTSLFTELKAGATNINWGGEIINNEADGRHTKTDMGSGQFATSQFTDAEFKKTAFIRAMQTVDLNNTLHDAPANPSDGTFASNSGCYNAQRSSDLTSDWGTYMFFGGTGFSSNCSI
ncbi:hypothetical protein R1flu_010104 [Riccia fluitans]|uniref:Neprosin PEP catalytic domain-containing protein n=1 Tax=Riccia fluitans TaxID=41844 RepID=A0ABD1Z726_9MARC